MIAATVEDLRAEWRDLERRQGEIREALQVPLMHVVEERLLLDEAIKNADRRREILAQLIAMGDPLDVRTAAELAAEGA